MDIDGPTSPTITYSPSSPISSTDPSNTPFVLHSVQHVMDEESGDADPDDDQSELDDLDSYRYRRLRSRQHWTWTFALHLVLLTAHSRICVISPSTGLRISMMHKAQYLYQIIAFGPYIFNFRKLSIIHPLKAIFMLIFFTLFVADGSGPQGALWLPRSARTPEISRRRWLSVRQCAGGRGALAARLYPVVAYAQGSTGEHRKLIKVDNTRCGFISSFAPLSSPFSTSRSPYFSFGHFLASFRYSLLLSRIFSLSFDSAPWASHLLRRAQRPPLVLGAMTTPLQRLVLRLRPFSAGVSPQACSLTCAQIV